MRRLLKSVVEGKGLGDVSTLEDANSIEEIKADYENIKKALDVKAKAKLWEILIFKYYMIIDFCFLWI